MGFNGSDVNNTSNGFMLPVATVITCGTGSFGEGEGTKPLLGQGLHQILKVLWLALVPPHLVPTQCLII